MTFSIDNPEGGLQQPPPLGKYVWEKPSGEQGLHKILQTSSTLTQAGISDQKEYRSRCCHDKQFTLFQCTSTQFQESFFPESVALWDAIP